MEAIVVFITAGIKEEAENISGQLVAEKLVACCNLISPIQSIFSWKGDICNEQEILIIAKSTRARFQKIIERVNQLHSYETPEIIAIPIIDGSEGYLNWIADETGP